jgi:hypothetical protein
MEYRTLWGGASVSLNFATLTKESRDKKEPMGLKAWSAICKTCGKKMKAWDGIEYFVSPLNNQAFGWP